MFVESATISNLRTLAATEVHFRHPDNSDEVLALPNVNLLLGNNGSGKSTVLRALALAVLTPVIESAGYVPRSMVRRQGNQTAEYAEVSVDLRLHPQDIDKGRPPREPVRLSSRIYRRRSTEYLEAASDTKKPLWDGMFDDESPSFLMVGYGATRRVESGENFDSANRRKARHLRYQRVSSLFEDHVSLTPLAAWLPRLESTNRGRWTQVVDLINRLLPHPFGFKGVFSEGEYLFTQDSAEVAFQALSDGYRAYIGWIGDLLYHVCMGCPRGKKLIDNRGIVMVDEIDLHLHPEWQRTVVPVISKNLPNIQFIFTSHSPLVTGTLQAQNIHVLESVGEGGFRVMQIEEEVHGRTSEQVLLSSYFNLGSTRAPDFLQELEGLVAQSSSTNPAKAIDAMKRLVSKTGTSTGGSGGKSFRIPGTKPKPKQKRVTIPKKKQVAPSSQRG